MAPARRAPTAPARGADDAQRSQRTPRRYPAAARELLRETLLDSARELLGERGWAQVTMAEVAVRAGVSRQTLYNTFGSRDELAQALVLRERERMLAGVEETIATHRDDPVRALAAALEWFLDRAAEDPALHRALTDQEPDGMVPLLTTRGAPVVLGATTSLAELIAVEWPSAPRADVEVMADSLVRLAISHAMLPTATPRATARSLAALLAPQIRRVLG
jgi:AcrR family transcriptional regulator